MARIAQDIRDSKGRYIKVTVLLKIKSLCNRFMLKLERWLK